MATIKKKKKREKKYLKVRSDFRASSRSEEDRDLEEIVKCYTPVTH